MLANIWNVHKHFNSPNWPAYIGILAVAYGVLFFFSGSLHHFLIGNPLIPVQVGDCTMQRPTVCVEANMENAKLIRADLSGANLAGANLSGANLWHADLSGANLSGADLRRANLTGADLSSADLSGAVLDRAMLDGAVLDGVSYDSATRWPQRFEPPSPSK